jgi:hypothetical protein
LLEDISGVQVKGYRAPSFSIGAGNLWAFDCLLRAGYRYSSSIYPIRTTTTACRIRPRHAHEVRPGLLEVPITTLRLLNRNFPSSGGGYFRLLPYALSRWMLGRVNRGDGQPASSISTPGRSTRASRASTASAARRGSATTSTSAAWRAACARLLR